MKKNLLFIILSFLLGCSEEGVSPERGEVERKLRVANEWPTKIRGELVIIEVISDDTGIIWANGWVEPTTSDERIGLVFKEKALNTIDLTYDPVGVFEVLVGSPGKYDFPVVKVNNVK